MSESGEAKSAKRPRMKAKPYVRKQYWNQPEMSWWERAYLFEIVRGMSITGGVFIKNMWRWITLRKGALTTNPEEVPRRRRQHRGKQHVRTR
jgi:NADH-quinone oxidoreductase subunit I